MQLRSSYSRFRRAAPSCDGTAKRSTESKAKDTVSIGFPQNTNSASIGLHGSAQRGGGLTTVTKHRSTDWCSHLWRPSLLRWRPSLLGARSHLCAPWAPCFISCRVSPGAPGIHLQSALSRPPLGRTWPLHGSCHRDLMAYNVD